MILENCTIKKVYYVVTSDGNAEGKISTRGRRRGTAMASQIILLTKPHNGAQI